MIESQVPHPRIVRRGDWLAARKEHLAREKELTKKMDKLRAERRRLPMVKVEKDYVFDGPDGKRSLLDLFDERRQLIVYHFMFDPKWEKGCPGCTSFIDALGDLSMLADRNTSFTAISRAPFAKLAAYKAAKGWDIPWHSSSGNDFNYDFHVTLDESVAPVEYNFEDMESLEARGVPNQTSGESHGLSVFFRLNGDVFHTYSFLRARSRKPDGLLQPARRDPLWPSGRLRGLAGRLAAKAHLWLSVYGGPRHDSRLSSFAGGRAPLL